MSAGPSNSENISPAVVMSVAKELRKLSQEPLDGIKVIVNEEDITDVTAEIMGPGAQFLAARRPVVSAWRAGCGRGLLLRIHRCSRTDSPAAATLPGTCVSPLLLLLQLLPCCCCCHCSRDLPAPVAPQIKRHSSTVSSR